MKKCCSIELTYTTRAIHSQTDTHTNTSTRAIYWRAAVFHFIFERKFIGPLHWQMGSSYINSVSAYQQKHTHFRSIRLFADSRTHVYILYIYYTQIILHCQTHTHTITQIHPFLWTASPAFRCQWHIVKCTTMINWRGLKLFSRQKNAVPRERELVTLFCCLLVQKLI